MSDQGRRDRPARRRFRPIVGEALESRELMSTLTPGAIFLQRRAMLARQLMIGQRGSVDRFVTAAGSAVTVTDTDGERYRVQLTGEGAVTSTSLPDGRIGLVVRGTNTLSQLDVVPLSRVRVAEGAHTFGPYKAFGDGMLNIGLLDVYGPINGIFGYNTAKLSGPLVVRDGTTVDRIALADLEPGASVSVGGTLNQLEVLRSAHLAGAGTGINTGLDLNVLNVGGFLTLNDGAGIRVGRDLGLIEQAASGTGRGGRGARIDGGVFIAEGSRWSIDRTLAAAVLDLGDFVGTSRFVVGNGIPTGGLVVVGTSIP
ncbi:hypothetical protein [Tautonia plasticadhaerens]|uniref:Uncharacterized protein n=1 Tax=Tautonia plasticadhaerens TaxID=2527974 RepID=A0A518GUP8_9BACT|nr:hypothetical protein [Tautonia plasticadhaerens]QDV32318.1 hypothetical protein ElP_01460 [Tautonia plasticadhaerens]